MPDRHAIISLRADCDTFGFTAHARCACGAKRQAGAFPAYPGRAGAILLVTERFDCGDGLLTEFRVTHPFPSDPGSLEASAVWLDREGADLRSQAAGLLERAAKYEAASERVRADYRAVQG